MFKIVHTSYDHTSGTKDYSLTSIISESGKSVLIKRWGKAEHSGARKIDSFDSVRSLGVAVLAESMKRAKKGYKEVWRQEWLDVDEEDLSHILAVNCLKKISASHPDFIGIKNLLFKGSTPNKESEYVTPSQVETKAARGTSWGSW
ncbi:MAG: hypothetical protein ABJG42_24530 [Vibrio splendidus]